MNYVALNQNILGKKLVIGSGFVGGTEKEPFLSEEKFKIYLNGKHELPELTEIDQRSPLGEITHPYAMSGMPNSPGLITYELLVGEEFYAIIATLELTDVDDEPAVDVIGLSLRNDFPSNIDEVNENVAILLAKIFIFHFDNLFSFYKNFEELESEGWIIEGQFLQDVTNHYFSKKNEKNI